MMFFSIIKTRNPLLIKYCFMRQYCNVNFCNIYKKYMGKHLGETEYKKIKKKSPNIDKLSQDRMQCTLQILNKFNITAVEACKNPHIFCMNPITMDNYGEILKECGFVKILPIHIIRYHTLVRSRTISQLKKQGLMSCEPSLEERLLLQFKDWPDDSHTKMNFDESKTSILNVRLYTLEKYLEAKLNVTPEDFAKYCRNYLTMKHKPMADIQEALSLAHNELGLDLATIRRNAFLIAADPVKLKLNLEKVKTLAGLDMKQVARIDPAVLKNDHESLLRIRSLLEEYRISHEAQRRCLRIYCMCPKTVKERLEELNNMKEYNILASNPRALWLVVYKNKMLARLNKIQAANKNCFSLNHLVASRKVFKDYITSFGDKICGRDLAVVIQTRLDLAEDVGETSSRKPSKRVEDIAEYLKRHKFWHHTALSTVADNITYLKNNFTDTAIYRNAHILFYPNADVESYVSSLQSLRGSRDNRQVGAHLQDCVDCSRLTDEQLLSLALYEIEKQYDFTGDGVWNKQSCGIESNSFS